MSTQEQAKCDFCCETKPVQRFYVRVANKHFDDDTQGRYSNYIKYCQDCGIITDQGERIATALEYAEDGAFDGEHHKTWAIDQMVRALTGCPMETVHKKDVNGKPYSYERQGESEEYKKWLAEFAQGEDGPHTYSWDVGIAP